MQNDLINENKELKEYKTRVISTLKEVKTTLIPSGRSKANIKVGQLIDSLFN
jgi:hypothetical protein